jgi:hypothetical protein
MMATDGIKRLLKTIDHGAFARAINQSYDTLSEVGSANLATRLIRDLNSMLEPAVEAWITGQDIPDVAAGQYSVNKILAIRNSRDYLETFRLLSEYIEDSAEGEKKIWRPKRVTRSERA